MSVTDTPVGLTTLERLRLHVNRDATDNSKDDKLVFYGEVMSERVAEYCRREFAPTPTEVDDDTDPVARQFEYDGSGHLSLDPYDLRLSDDLEIILYSDEADASQQTLTASDYRLSPRGGTKQATYLGLDLPMPRFRTTHRGFDWQVTITGHWGMLTTPRTVELAVLVAVEDIILNPGSLAAQSLGGYAITPDIIGPSFDTDPRGGLPRTALWALSPFRRRNRVGSIRLQAPYSDLQRRNAWRI